MEMNPFWLGLMHSASMAKQNEMASFQVRTKSRVKETSTVTYRNDKRVRVKGCFASAVLPSSNNL